MLCPSRGDKCGTQARSAASFPSWTPPTTHNSPQSLGPGNILMGQQTASTVPPTATALHLLAWHRQSEADARRHAKSSCWVVPPSGLVKRAHFSFHRQSPGDTWRRPGNGSDVPVRGHGLPQGTGGTGGGLWAVTAGGSLQADGEPGTGGQPTTPAPLRWVPPGDPRCRGQQPAAEPHVLQHRHGSSAAAGFAPNPGGRRPSCGVPGPWRQGSVQPTSPQVHATPRRHSLRPPALSRKPTRRPEPPQSSALPPRVTQTSGATSPPGATLTRDSPPSQAPSATQVHAG